MSEDVNTGAQLKRSEHAAARPLGARVRERIPRAVAAVLALVSIVLAPLGGVSCEGSKPRLGSETNFLSSCDADCGEGFSCICGVCTRACSASDECTSITGDAECVKSAERSAEAACSSTETAAFCDVVCSSVAECAEVGASYQCLNGYCRAPDVGAAAELCPEATLAVGDNQRTVTVGDVARSYLVRLPASYTGTSAVPLVLDYHTLGGTPAGEADASGYRELAEQEGFVVVWPEGIDAAWNIGVCCTTSPDVDDIAFSREIVDQMQREACIDRNRVYAVGVANGGGMAYHLACNAADLVAGIAPSSFDLLSESEQPCAPERPVTEISFRGTEDALVPYDGGTEQLPSGLDGTITFLGAIGTFEKWAELDQCSGSPSTQDNNGCETYSECKNGEEVTLCTSGDGMGWGDAAIAWEALSRHSLP